MADSSVFTSRDMDTLLATGGFAGMDADSAADAIALAVANPVDDKGRPVPPDQYDSRSAARYLVSEYADVSAAEALAAGAAVSRRVTDERRRHVAAALSSVAGVDPAEYESARLSRDAGDPSDMLRLYSKYIERS